MYKHGKSDEVLMTFRSGDELNPFLFDDHHFSDTRCDWVFYGSQPSDLIQIASKAPTVSAQTAKKKEQPVQLPVYRQKKTNNKANPAAPRGAEPDLCDRHHRWVNVVLLLKHIAALLNSAFLEVFQHFSRVWNSGNRNAAKNNKINTKKMESRSIPIQIWRINHSFLEKNLFQSSRWASSTLIVGQDLSYVTVTLLETLVWERVSSSYRCSRRLLPRGRSSPTTCCVTALIGMKATEKGNKRS